MTQSLPLCAYLDIETTGLDPHDYELTVIGICRDDGEQASLPLPARRGQTPLGWLRQGSDPFGEVTALEVIQLVGDDITPEALKQALRGVKTVYTYNGHRFDLPFIKTRLGVDVKGHRLHWDLMHTCHQRGLYGGFKGVERKLGISRLTEGVNGYMAVQLWHDYVNNGNEEALNLLLEYNREDVVNLRTLRHKLGV